MSRFIGAAILIAIFAAVLLWAWWPFIAYAIDQWRRDRAGRKIARENAQSRLMGAWPPK
jgi:hypothetical protein